MSPSPSTALTPADCLPAPRGLAPPECLPPPKPEVEITVESILKAKDHYQVLGMKRSAAVPGLGLNNEGQAGGDGHEVHRGI